MSFNCLRKTYDFDPFRVINDLINYRFSKCMYTMMVIARDLGNMRVEIALSSAMRSTYLICEIFSRSDFQCIRIDRGDEPSHPILSFLLASASIGVL